MITDIRFYRERSQFPLILSPLLKKEEEEEEEYIRIPLMLCAASTIYVILINDKHSHSI